jgi:hypothetical protein
MLHLAEGLDASNWRRLPYPRPLQIATFWRSPARPRCTASSRRQHWRLTVNRGECLRLPPDEVAAWPRERPSSWTRRWSWGRSGFQFRYEVIDRQGALAAARGVRGLHVVAGVVRFMRVLTGEQASTSPTRTRRATPGHFLRRTTTAPS